MSLESLYQMLMSPNIFLITRQRQNKLGSFHGFFYFNNTFEKLFLIRIPLIRNFTWYEVLTWNLCMKAMLVSFTRRLTKQIYPMQSY